jgi:MFS family permease
MPVFWMLLTAIGVGAGCLTAMIARVVPILTDRNISVTEATLVVSVFAMTTAGWQIVMGTLLDRSGSPKIVAPLYIVSVIGMLLLELTHTLPLLVGAGLLMGIGMGTEYGVLPYFISRYFGLRRFGNIAGVMYFVVAIAQGVTPWLMDQDFDHHHSYLLAMHVIEVLLVIGAGIIACLPAYKATQRLWLTESEAEAAA